MSDPQPSGLEPQASPACETLARRIRTLNLVRRGVPPAQLNLQRDLLVRPEGEPTRDAGGYRRVQLGTHARASSYYARYNALTGEPISWLFAAPMQGSTRKLDAAQATQIATEAAQPPPDAVLERAEYETQGGVTTFVAAWKHVHDGLRVERDRIQVRLNGETGKVFSVYRLWHQVDERLAHR